VRARSITIVGIFLLVGVALGIVSSPVEAQGYLGGSAGFYHPENGDRDYIGTFGLRGGYRFNPYFGLEGSLSQVSLDETLPIDIPFFELGGLELGRLDNLDLSLQWFPNGGNFLLFGGIGGSRLDSTLRITDSFFGQTLSSSDTAYIFTAHVGLGYQWQIGDRFLLRPEARLRHYYGQDPKTLIPGAYRGTDYEAGLTFGWRFGGR
jgi:Outer membrane protein beta-barrel domain